jgi:two-component system, chemotaxis family, sensor kinase CheA
MNPEELKRELLLTFVTEIDEQVQVLNRDLLALEKTADPTSRAELVRSIFRVAHSLKGAARAVDVTPIERFCHRLEEALSPVRDGRAPLSPDLVALTFAAADALTDAADRLRSGRELAGSPLEALEPGLEANRSGAVSPPRPPPAPAGSSTIEPPRAATTPPPSTVSSPPAREPESPAPRSADAAIVRVTAEKLDALLATSGELTVARHRVSARPAELLALQELVRRSREECRQIRTSSRKRSAANAFAGAEAIERLDEGLQRLDREIDRLAKWLRADSRRIEQLSATLGEEVHQARMLPFAEACRGFERIARDLGHASGKEIAITIEGGNVELDRAIIERLRDPLRHLLRNAIDHGLESPEERRARGKPAQGRLVVKAELRGGQVEVVVADDGRGLDLAALREQGRRRGLATSDDPSELARLIFLPGLSTAKSITDVSGRGVGLDVVKSEVETLHGSVDVRYEPNRGASFVLTVPLTLTILRALLFRASGRTFAVPSVAVAQLVRTSAGTIRRVEGRDVLVLGGAPVPIVTLAGVLGFDRDVPTSDGRSCVLLLSANEQRVGFVVDEFLTEQDVMVKNLGKRIARVRHVSGATILPDGSVALVLNAADLARSAVSAAVARPVVVTNAAAVAGPRKRLLVVDDSVTTRSLEKSILEAAGYEVVVASDGEAAWQLLQRQEIDLVVSDVDMPRMDGFALTEAVRASERVRDLPVVLVTARATEEDRARGVAAGANAYLTKSAFDQRNLLETIAQLL